MSEENRRDFAEAVWQDGEAAHRREEAGKAALFEKAIDARGRGLCSVNKQGRDRIFAMRRVVKRRVGGGQAEAVVGQDGRWCVCLLLQDRWRTICQIKANLRILIKGLVQPSCCPRRHLSFSRRLDFSMR